MTVGAVVSTTRFFEAPSEPLVPGAGRVVTVSLVAVSRIQAPPGITNDAVEA